MSVTRFSGVCKINGVSYILDHDTDHLVRHDIWQQEIKDKAKQKRVAAAENKRWEVVTQAGLLGQIPAASKGIPL